MKHNDKARVLIFIQYYLPGYRSGGPVKSISNLVEELKDEFDFFIFTLDRDAMDTETYSTIKINEWNSVGNVNVFYASDDRIVLSHIKKIFNETNFDILYLNSFFSIKFTLYPLIIRKLFKPKTPCIIAPRGEFSEGALRLKFFKKFLYIVITKNLKFYKNIVWQASSKFEENDLIRELKVNKDSIMVAPNIVKQLRFNIPNYSKSTHIEKVLRLVFLSRISKKKNLHFAIDQLIHLNQEVYLDIYGPLDDPVYWKMCKGMIEKAPKSVCIKYKGEVEPQNVHKILNKYDLLIFPTLGENFGHVIIESLIAGTPVLISNKTPWGDTGDNVINVESLENYDFWQKKIQEFINMSIADKIALKYKSVEFASNYLADRNNVLLNRKLLQSTINKRDN